MINISKSSIEAMGYQKYPTTDKLHVKFNLIKIFSFPSYRLDSKNITKPVVYNGNHYECTALIGNSINKINQFVYNDDYVENEADWESRSKGKGPYLYLNCKFAEVHKISGGYRQKVEDKIETFKEFEPARGIRDEWEDKELPAIMIAIKTSFSSERKNVIFTPVDSCFFGFDQRGVQVFDNAGPIVRATATVSSSLNLQKTTNLLKKSEKIFHQLNSIDAKHYHVAVNEEDHLKRFFSLYLFIETYTNKTLDALKTPPKPSRLLNVPKRLKQSSLLALTERKIKNNNLFEAFLWCSIFVWKNIDDKDISDFNEVKDARNQLAHGKRFFDDASLPLEKAQRIAFKILSSKVN